MRRIRWFWFFIILLSIAPAAQARSFAQHTTQSEYHRYIIRLAGEPLALAAESLGAISGQNGKLLTQQTSLQNYKTALHRNRQASLRQIQQTLGRELAIIHTYDTVYHGIAIELSEQEAEHISTVPGILDVQLSQTYEVATNQGPDLIGATKIHTGETSGIFAATLLGTNMTPAINSNITGRARLTFDSGSKQLRLNITLNTAGSTSAQLIRTSDKSVIDTWQPSSATSYAATVTLNANDQTLLHNNGLFVRISTSNNPQGEIGGPVSGYRGEGVIIGVLDTGINLTHPSFAELGGDGYRHLNPLGQGNFLGACNPTNQYHHASIKCNNKLIGAWTFPGTAQVGNQITNEPSPHDDLGHGSHVASTAAGNIVHNVSLGNNKVTIMGVAPHANIIAYDVCGISVNGSIALGHCFGETLLAGIEQAVLDGVDVINYSIHGGEDPWNDPIEQAFLAAHQAGVVVSTGAGNVGAVGSVSHAGPWLMTTAATTLNRAPNQADQVADFSSRGPSYSTLSNIIKPDLAAPGVDIFAASMNYAGTQENYYLNSGTSMAAPHAAGSAALLAGLYPEWTPSEIQSALMLTATPNVNTFKTNAPTTPLDRGSGRIQVAQAASTGLVLNETSQNFQRANPFQGGNLQQLNLASMANTACVSTCTWTRTFRNTRDSAIEWQVSTNHPNLSATPNTFTIPANGTQTVVFTFDVSKQELGTTIHAQATLTNAAGLSPELRLPVLVIPSTNNIEDRYYYRQTNGNARIIEQIQHNQDVQIKVSGMVKGTTTEVDIPSLEGHIETISITSPNDNLIIDIRSTNSTNPIIYIAHDADNNGIYDGKDTLVGYSDHQYCAMNNLAAGTYFIYIYNGDTSAYPTHHFNYSWAVINGDQKNLNLITTNNGNTTTLNQQFALNSKVGDSWYGAYTLIDKSTNETIGMSSIAYHHITTPFKITQGHHQYALLNADFASPLQVQLTDEYGKAYANQTITFSAPTSGASATFIGSNTVTTDAQGFASVQIKANGVEGAYSIKASTSSGQSLTFDLKNLSKPLDQHQYLGTILK